MALPPLQIHPLLERFRGRHPNTPGPEQSLPSIAPEAVQLRLAWQDPELGWLLRLHRDGQHVGKLGYRVCEKCRWGSILKISIYDPLRGCGLGRRVVSLLREQHPGLTWHTIGQYPEAIRVWQQMAAESGQPYDVQDIRCHPVPEPTPLDGYLITSW